MKKSLLILFSFILVGVSAHANTVTVPSDPLVSISTTTYLPIAINAGSSNQSAGCYSVSQQLYYASELAGASSNTINAITFYYNEGTTMTRKLRVWINNTSLDDFPTPNSTSTPNFVAPGTKVFSGDVNLKEPDPYTITFNTPFVWDGTSNIIVTVFDSTGLFNSITDLDVSSVYTPRTQMFADEGRVRFLHKISRDKNFDNAGWTMDNLTEATAYNITPANRKYANKITFTFAAAAVVPATPSDLAASPSVTSASLSWTAVDGATSYMLAYSTDGSIFSELATPTSNSYEWTGLTAASTYYVKVAAVNSAGSSDFSAPISFTTLATHIHDGISFEPWSNPSALPTSGNYYLANDVALDPYDPTTITLTGNLNLCLNGHTANVYGTKIVVPDGKTLAIYDNVGNGKLTGFVASEVGAFDIYAEALICVYSGGTLVLKQGTIENTYIPDEYSSYAIYSNGTLHISGDVLINSNSADIYLYASNIIVLDGAISNAEKHTVWKNGGTFTSGWSTYMSGENPRDFFESANAARSVCLNEGEASLRMLLSLSESSNNSAIGTYVDQVIDVNLTRSLTSAQYNTFCLPFALNNAQLEDLFGAGYDLEEFVSSSLDGDVLTLAFNKVTSLTAGKPYLLQPSVNVSNPSFVGVTITETDPVDITTTYVDFKGVYRPTELEGGNKNLLFLGANDELFWPETTGNIKGFRAYFEVKGSAAKAAKHARIVKNESQTQAIDNIESTNTAQKRLIDGQLFIEKNGTLYNACGQRVK